MRRKGLWLAAAFVLVVGLLAATGWIEDRRAGNSEVGWSPLYQRRVTDALVPVTAQAVRGAAALATTTPGCDWYVTCDCHTAIDLPCDDIEWPTEAGQTCDTCDQSEMCHPPDSTLPQYDLDVYTMIEGTTCAGSTCDVTCRTVCWRFFFDLVPTYSPTCAGPTCEGDTCFLAKCDVLDYGDAPQMSDAVAGAQYETTKDLDGARHVIDGVFYLGAREDAESDGRPTDLADGDDGGAYQMGDDEDGVWFPTTFNPGRKATVIVSNSQPGTLFVCLDYDQSRSWQEEADNVFPEGAQLLSAYNWVVIDVPEIAVASPSSYARFRFTESEKVGDSGLAENGEVEDYRVPISASFRAWLIVDKLLYAPGDAVKVGFYVNETSQVTLVCHRPDGTQRLLSTTTAEVGRRTFPEPQEEGLVAELLEGTGTIEMIATSLLSGATVWLTTPYVVSQ